MTLYLVLGGLALVVVLVLAAAIYGSSETDSQRSEHDLLIYRDQLRELERDLGSGRLSPQEAEAARIEIQRRILKAGSAPDDKETALAGRLRLVSLLLLLLMVPGLAGLIYSENGSPELAGTDARRQQAVDPEQQQQIEGMVARLAQRMQDNPDDLLGWMLLGRSYVTLERFDEAVTAYANATRVDPDSAAALMGLAEAQVFAAQGAITPAAISSFQSVLDRDPQHAGARYYLALARLQAGDPRSAMQGFLALAKDSPADAPWWPTLEARIREVAQQLGQNAEDLLPKRAPGPTREQVEAAQSMSPDERAGMIRSMVTRLEDRLKATPDDVDGWMRLGRAYRAMDELEKSRSAFARAATLDPASAMAAQEHGVSILMIEMPNLTDDRTPLPKAAEAEFRRLLAMAPDNPDALWYVGEAEARAGRGREAALLWTRLLARLDPKDPDYAELKKKLEELPK